MYEWELPVPKAPRFPDPKSENQFVINTRLVKIVTLLWNRTQELENRLREVQKELFEVKNFQEGN